MFEPVPGSVERELGVPIPGRIVPPDQWARTSLKRVPPGPIDFPALFGRSAPVVIDIGCGNGRSLLHSAVARPEFDHLGLDILPVVIRYATRRANQRGLSNARLAVIGGLELLRDHIAPGSVTEIHCYHPQPYYRMADVGKRLITPEFLRLAHRALVPGGLLRLQTDHPAYWKYIQQIVPVFFEWTDRREPWPNVRHGMTRRELMARRQGLSIFRGEGQARIGLDPDEAERIAAELPLPKFNADRRLQQLDDQERRAKPS
jgi:tRNA (guanine-N7-)-methyltransferase